MKLGLGESYDDVSILSKKARGYLDLTKPASTLGVIGVYFVGSLFFFFYTNQQHLIMDKLTIILHSTISIGLIHGAAQSMNMSEDAEMDRQTEHKQNRPIPAGIVDKEDARTLAWFAVLFGVGRAYAINVTFGVFASVMAVFGIFYNLDPIRAKERIISIPWQATSRGLLAFPLIWSAYGDPWSVTPWVLGMFMYFYVFGFQNTADILDRYIDAEYGIKTFVVVFGIDSVRYIAAGSMALMVSTIILAINFNLLPVKMMWMIMIIPFCIMMLYHLTYNTYEVDETTGNHPTWLFYYLGLVLSVTIPLLVEVYIHMN